ncbi:hypothetical protein L208DRAFT_1381894 [Tricholoma matsutake]|nr:hypothetical protein L208DRAFT_1381894 [Tricholoma matsutake 945]
MAKRWKAFKHCLCSLSLKLARHIQELDLTIIISKPVKPLAYGYFHSQPSEEEMIKVIQKSQDRFVVYLGYVSLLLPLVACLPAKTPVDHQCLTLSEVVEDANARMSKSALKDLELCSVWNRDEQRKGVVIEVGNCPWLDLVPYFFSFNLPFWLHWSSPPFVHPPNSWVSSFLPLEVLPDDLNAPKPEPCSGQCKGESFKGFMECHCLRNLDHECTETEAEKSVRKNQQKEWASKRKPGKKGPAVFMWELVDGYWIQKNITCKEVPTTWDIYSHHQIWYNSFNNKFNCCSEFEDEDGKRDQDSDENSDDFMNENPWWQPPACPQPGPSAFVPQCPNVNDRAHVTPSTGLEHPKPSPSVPQHPNVDNYVCAHQFAGPVPPKPGPSVPQHPNVDDCLPPHQSAGPVPPKPHPLAPVPQHPNVNDCASAPQPMGPASVSPPLPVQQPLICVSPLQVPSATSPSLAPPRETPPIMSMSTPCLLDFLPMVEPTASSSTQTVGGCHSLHQELVQHNDDPKRRSQVPLASVQGHPSPSSLPPDAMQVDTSPMVAGSLNSSKDIVEDLLYHHFGFMIGSAIAHPTALAGRFTNGLNTWKVACCAVGAQELHSINEHHSMMMDFLHAIIGSERPLDNILASYWDLHSQNPHRLSDYNTALHVSRKTSNMQTLYILRLLSDEDALNHTWLIAVDAAMVLECIR